VVQVAKQLLVEQIQPAPLMWEVEPMESVLSVLKSELLVST